MSSAVNLTNKQFLTCRKEDIQLKLHFVAMRLQALSEQSQEISILYSNEVNKTDDATTVAAGAPLPTGYDDSALYGTVADPSADVQTGEGVGATTANGQVYIDFTDGNGGAHHMTYEAATTFIASESKALELKSNDLQAQLTETKTEIDSCDKLLGEDIKKEYAYTGS
jgi:hypothetical protein